MPQLLMLGCNCYSSYGQAGPPGLDLGCLDE